MVFRTADLRDVDFTCAYLENTDTTGAKMSGARFWNEPFPQCEFVEFEGRHGSLYWLDGRMLVQHVVSSGEVIKHKLEIPQQTHFAHVALSPPRNILAGLSYAGSHAYNLMLNDVGTGRKIKLPSYLSRDITALAFFPDNEHLALGYARLRSVSKEEFSNLHPELNSTYYDHVTDLVLAVIHISSGEIESEYTVSRNTSGGRINKIAVPHHGKRLACDVMYADYCFHDSKGWKPFTLLFRVGPAKRLEKMMDIHPTHYPKTIFSHDGDFFVTIGNERDSPYLYTADGECIHCFEANGITHIDESHPLPRPPEGDPIGFTRDNRFLITWREGNVGWTHKIVLFETGSGKEYASFPYLGMYCHGDFPYLSSDNESLMALYFGDEYYGGHHGTFAVLFNLHYDERRTIQYKVIKVRC